MKKQIVFVFITTFLLSYVQGVMAQPVVGKVTAYYAKRNYIAHVEQKEFDYEKFTIKKGELLWNTNNFHFSIKSINQQYYRVGGSYQSDYTSYKIPKRYVSFVSYTMNQLPISMIGKGLTFVSPEGFKARIFKASLNGHAFYSFDDNYNYVYDEKATHKYKNHYVLSIDYIPGYSNNNKMEHKEYVIDVVKGNLKLYQRSTNYENQSKRTTAILKGIWVNSDSYGDEKSAYDDSGRMLTDKCEIDGISDDICVAYIASKKALYIHDYLDDGKFYYLKK